MSSREFNQDVSRAKRAAKRGPVIITDRGRPAYVLMRHETYQRLTSRTPDIGTLLAMPETDEIEFDAPRLGREPFQPAELE